MIVVPARVSPPRSLPQSLPASPVHSAAPAVVIRHAVEPVAATPAVTLQTATTRSHSPHHSLSHFHTHSYAPYYPPTAAAAATPAAVFDAPPHPYRHPRHHQHATKVAVAAHPTDHRVHHVCDRSTYCEHHFPSHHQEVAAAEHHGYTPVVYTQSNSSVSHLPVRVVYQSPPTSSYYQVVYDAPPAAVVHHSTASTPTHVCSHANAPASPYQHSSLNMVAQQPSLSPPLKPQPHRLTPTTPPRSLSTSSGSAFTPVLPIAMYPRTGIMIQ